MAEYHDNTRLIMYIWGSLEWMYKTGIGIGWDYVWLGRPGDSLDSLSNAWLASSGRNSRQCGFPGSCFFLSYPSPFVLGFCILDFLDTLPQGGLFHLVVQANCLSRGDHSTNGAATKYATDKGCPCHPVGNAMGRIAILLPILI